MLNKENTRIEAKKLAQVREQWNKFDKLLLLTLITSVIQTYFSKMTFWFVVRISICFDDITLKRCVIFHFSMYDGRNALFSCVMQ